MPTPKSPEDKRIAQYHRERHIRSQKERDARADRRSGRLAIKQRSPYYAGSPHSFFRDLAARALHSAQTWRANEAGIIRGELWSDPFSGEDMQATHRRLDSVGRMSAYEKRDIALGAVGAFLPASGSLPTYLGEWFAEGARAQANLTAELPKDELPPSGMTVYAPRLSTGATVGVQATEADPPSEANVDETSEGSAVAYVTGMVDVSQQAWDRSAAPGFDEVLARDLGRALATKAEEQIIYGANTGGETLGLASTTGILTVTATDASPTSAEVIGSVWDAYAALSGSSGLGVSDLDQFITVVHPRRLAWLHKNTQASQSIAPQLPGKVVPCGSLRTTLGAGTNEDEIFVLVPSELPILPGPVTFIASEALSGTLQIRFVARQPFATLFGRAPKAICRISGTALVAP